jgi:dienelactone hydrolase
MGTSQFSLTEHLNDIALSYPMNFACCSGTIDEFRTWQICFRDELVSILGLQGRTHLPCTDTLLWTTDHGNYLEEKHSLACIESVTIPIYLLIPKIKGPHSAIVLFHGHDPSVQYCLGNLDDIFEMQKNTGMDNNYAQILAEAGYLVCVVVQRGLDVRLTDQIDERSGRSCRHLAFSYLMQGRTLLGERVWDGMVAMDYLQSRGDIKDNIGCTGHSAGGATALWLAALDSRIKVSVISGYFSSFADSIYAMPHCECNYVPKAGAAFEMGDLAALLAPNAVCFINGQNDELFPVEAARQQFETAKQVYNLINQSDACELFVHGGGHRYYKDKALSWFKSWMD